MTICNWEKIMTPPRLYLMSRIIQFLGYNPLEFKVVTLGQKIKEYRVERGLSLKKLAKIVDVDPGTLAR
jgi:predicted transcriptional regulator